MLKYSYLHIKSMVDFFGYLAAKLNSPSQTMRFNSWITRIDQGPHPAVAHAKAGTQSYSPSSGTTVRVTTLPASLMSWTMSLWESSMMERPLTAEIRSPTCSRPQRSVGLPSMIRPILCGITKNTHENHEITFYFCRKSALSSEVD